jgi:segregation and condensation protein A
MNYSVKLDNFEGPLDLLLFLVRKNEVDIQDIPILNITSQYMEYIEIMKSMNLDIAGEFLVMAATLMHIKSRSLLPKSDDDEEEDEALQSLDELKKQLLEYQQYREAAQTLKEQNILEKDVFTRTTFVEPENKEEGKMLGEAGLFDLLSALKNVIARAADNGSVMEVSVEKLSVNDKMNDILQLIQGKTDGLLFENLFAEDSTKLEIITTFLALLELMKHQALKIFQNDNFSSIYIYPVEDESTDISQTDEQQI